MVTYHTRGNTWKLAITRTIRFMLRSHERPRYSHMRLQLEETWCEMWGAKCAELVSEFPSHSHSQLDVQYGVPPCHFLTFWVSPARFSMYWLSPTLGMYHYRVMVRSPVGPVHILMVGNGVCGLVPSGLRTATTSKNDELGDTENVKKWPEPYVYI